MKKSRGKQAEEKLPKPSDLPDEVKQIIVDATTGSQGETEEQVRDHFLKAVKQLGRSATLSLDPPLNIH